MTIDRRRALWMLAGITAVGAAFRFYNLEWGTPYYHFHIDEHFVLAPADAMQRSMRDAAMSPKFFMYSPMLMYLVNALRWVFETLVRPLDLAVPADAVIYTVLGRSISAAFGTLTIPVVYAIAHRLGGRLAGLLAAALLACSVIHLRDSHFATTDAGLVFFCALGLLAALRVAERDSLGRLAAAGLAFAGAILFKYSGAFVLGVIGIAYLLGPSRPAGVRPISAWVRWGARGIVPIVVGIGTFLALDPLVIQYYDKFVADVRDWVVDPLRGETAPIWLAHFATLTSPALYWFTNLLWWGVGPALEIAGVVGVVWLLVRRDRQAFVAGSYAVLYFIAAGLNNKAPFVRYMLPLCPVLAVGAATVCANWVQSGRLNTLARLATVLLVGTTALYAAAYMNVFRQEDTRLSASRWMQQRIPPTATVLVEPSHNRPPTGDYLTSPNFYRDYVLWGNRNGEAERHEGFRLVGFDAYRFLYNPGVSDAVRSDYIQRRLALAEYIVIDETFVQFYRGLSASTHAVPKRYYEDLFAGRLPFRLVRTFAVTPSLFGFDIDDSAAEMTFRLFDHPRIYVFRREG